jgi:alpha-2-macroglobulin
MTRLLIFWSAIRRVVGRLFSGLWRGAILLASIVSRACALAFGRLQWHAPSWMPWTGDRIARGRRYVAARPRLGIGLAAAVIAAGAALAWYLTRPTPHYVTYAVQAPGLTEYDERGIMSIRPLVVTFSESTAPLQLVQRPVTAGIDLKPAIVGTWTWVDDRTLRFQPKDDWPVGAEFTVRFAKAGFAATGVRFEDYAFDFSSQPFAATIAESQFYQDPREPNLKKLVATVKFTHPVDTTQFESRVSLSVEKDAEYLGLSPDSRHFTVLYDTFKLAAFVHSGALGLPTDDTPMTLHVNKGVRAARGGNETADRLQAVVIIPGRASLRFSDARMTLVDNARYEPEQILMLASSSPVAERALAPHVAVRLLPVRHPRQQPEDKRPYDWRGQDVGQDILAKSDAVSVSYVPLDEGGNTSHGFKFLAPVGRYLHVTVEDGVAGIGGYVSGKPFVATVKVGPYHRALTFLGQGALLPLSGDKKIGFLVRDVARVDVEVGRVLPHQLQHLAPQMWDFSRPSLYEDIENTLVERVTTTRAYRDAKPGKPIYDSIDLGQYLQERSPDRHGLFLLHIRGSGAPERALDEDESEDEYDRDRDSLINDARLVLVTDVGLIAKQARDGSRDVFVQSIRTGAPVEGAVVDLLGTNGLPVFTAATDANGRARLVQPSREWVREKTPALILAQKDSDVAFLPLVGDRRLNFSRYDVGGVDNADSPQQLSTYLFSDRGIYRPGETTHLGLITRTADWKGALAGLPIDVEISDPRGALVSRTAVKLTDASFQEVAFTSQPAAPTGTYEVVAYLTKDPRRREALGSTSFRVQEFEPDRMKARIELSETPIEGWLRPDDVKARMTVAHLFGEPALNRRVDGEMNLTSVLPRFARYSDYRFQVGEALTEPYHEALAATTTNDAGVAAFTLDLKRFVGRAYRLDVLGRAYEAEGGRNVAAQIGAIVSDAAYLVGVKGDGDLAFVQRGSMRSARWLAVNQQLAPVPAPNLTLEWVQRKYLSVLTQQGNGTYKYVSRLREIVRDSRSVQIVSGGSAFPLPTQEPGDFLLVLRNSSGAELNKIAYTVAGQANLSRSLERNAELQVQLDRPAYSGGDTIAVSIRAPYIGAGLITIERDRVYHSQWFKTSTTSSVQRVTLPADFEGNGYVTVQFLRDPASDELFMSPLSYGVAPFSPNLEARTQQVDLVAPRVVKPGAALTLHLSAAEPSRAAVLAVDEGILQVARYQNPDPLQFFFQKRRLEVETRQILDLLLPEFKRFIALAAPGGDAEGGFARHLNPFNRKHKPPVAYWSGVIDVGPGGRDLRYTVPDYFNGRLRIVAVAASARRIGVSEATTEVKGDFVLTPNVPVMVAPGDEFLVSVGVFNNTTGGSGPIQLDVQLDSALSIVGPSRVDLQIADRKEGVGEFRVKANAVLGSASLRFTARRAQAESRLEESVSVRPAVAYRTQLTLGRLEGATATAAITRDLFSQRRTVEAAVSALPLVWGQGLTAYLDGYEYSCTEQLVSKGVGALILGSRPELGAVKSRDGRPLDSTIGVLRTRANERGGFGLWASTPITAEFPTVYAAHFLVEMKERGQPVPVDLLNGVNDWLARFASTPASSLGDARLRAYAVYLLARQGIRANAALSNVEQELTQRYTKQWPTDLAAAYLASTYRVMQRTDQAEKMIAAVPWSSTRRDLALETYYDPVVHDAQLLYLLSRHFPARSSNAPPSALETMSAAVNGNRLTSLSAAYTLLALDAYAKATTAVATFGISEVAKDGRERGLMLSAGVIQKAAILETASRLQFSKQGAAAGYFTLNESGFDRTPPKTEVAQGIEIFRELIDDKDNPLTRVAVGQEFFVRIRLRTTTRDRQSQVAVVDLLPGGVEPVLELQPAASTGQGVDPAQFRAGGGAASALPVGVRGRSTWSPQHLDMRDDRLVLYGDIGRDVSTFVYRVRAASAGTFQIPPAFAEGMYDRTVAGLSLAGKLEVVKP